MINLLRILPPLAEGTYNHKSITSDDWDMLTRRGKLFTRNKVGAPPDEGPYLDKLIFSIRKTSKLMEPFFEVRSGYILSEQFLAGIQKFSLPPHSLYAVRIEHRSTEHRHWFCYFYQSIKEHIDLERSVFDWVVPNERIYIPETGSFVRTIIRAAENLKLDDLKYLSYAHNGEALHCSKLVFKSSLMVYDLFELDLDTPVLYVKPSVVEMATDLFKGVEVISSNAYIDI
jgi:hypothetical protein